MNAAEKQIALNQMTYPPTHSYKFDGFIPTDQLKVRVGHINKECPSFLGFCKDFLDIGCNKGFFAFHALSNLKCNTVDAIDNRREFIDLCTLLDTGRKNHVHFEHTGLRDFHSDKQYDRIFVGNVNHYLFSEASGTYDWVYKLAAMSRGLVLVEGPMDMNCPDMSGVFDLPEYEDRFTREAFLEKMLEFFDLVHHCPAVSFEPGREMTLWCRKENKFFRTYQEKDIINNRTIAKTSTSNIFGTVLNKQSCIAKVYRDMNDNHRNAMHTANILPHTSDPVGIMVDGQYVFKGWIEKEADPLLQYLHSFEELWSLHCRHQLILLNCGYIDTDMALSAFLVRDEKAIIIDKNGVIPFTTLKGGDSSHGNIYFKAMRDRFSVKLFESKQIVDLIDAWDTVDRGELILQYTNLMNLRDSDL